MRRSPRLTGAAGSILGLLLATAATADPGLSLRPTRTLDRTFSEGTWMMPSLSPDGRTILFDLLGDIWSVDAKGGAAHPVLTGMPYDYHPVFSPDGRQFAFISDRSGVVSLWVADADGGNLHQLSHDDTLTIMSSPVWAADGKSVYVSRLKHDVLAFGLWRYPLDGGAPEPTIREQPHGEDWDHRINALEGAISTDGRTLYYSRKIGTTWTEKQPPNWSIVRRDLATGDETVLIEGDGGAMGVALSHDGKSLVYAARAGATDELRLRDLDTGEDRRIAGPIDRDAQEQGYYIGLIPRFGFTPDDKALVTSVGGKLVRIDVASGRIDPIPFSAHVQLPMGPLTRVQQHEDTGPVHARVIQYPTQSPDGNMLAFTALGTLYTEALDGQAKPKAVPGVVGHAFQPRWSPDGKRLTYVTWDATEGGAVWTIPARGGRPTRLTRADAFYTEPLFTPDGRTVVALRASQYDRLRAETEMDPKRATDIVKMPATGGAATLVTHAFGARSPDFGADPQRIRFYAPEGASSIRLDGTGLKREFSVLAHPASQYFSAPAPVQGVWLAPDGRHALIRNSSELWLADVPPGGDGRTAPSINLDHPPAGTTKLTRIGADFAQWADGGRSLVWSLGATWHRVPLASIDRASTGSTEAQAQTFAADVTVPRDVPRDSIVLRGATVVTMRGDEVIGNADVVVQDNRIAAVGPSGSVAVPAGAAIRDVSGKYIVPGFVDAHAHWFETRRGVQDDQAWDFLINLAYGVTSGLDPQSFDTDVFVYKDMIDAGLMLGPRAWSTGPGVFVDGNIVSEQAAEDVLTRYRDYYKDRNIKSYMVGDRARRQFMVEAARKLGMMETTEGASDYELDVTHAIDGFSGNEHSLPIAPLHDDVTQLFAWGGTSFVPTLGVLYGGEPPFSDEIIYGNLPDDPKIRHFMPSGVLAAKQRDLHWSPAQAQSYPAFAANAIRIQRAGGVVGAGSHGTVQGLAFHWELEALASGGTAMEALRAGTIGSATAIGHAADVGSIEPGKFADLLVLDADPTADIRNTRSIHWVMKNGRIYDPATLDEIAPTPRKLGPLWFAGKAP
jgi:Tol biopolymer transport system component